MALQEALKYQKISFDRLQLDYDELKLKQQKLKEKHEQLKDQTDRERAFREKRDTKQSMPNYFSCRPGMEDHKAPLMTARSSDEG